MVFKTTILFIITAFAEILGCYLPYLWLREGKSVWLLIPGALSLAIYAWLLTLHEQESAGRVYAVYGGIYVFLAMFWMWGVEKVRPDRWDALGVVFILIGCSVIYFSPHGARVS